jgi:hypothetical protein
MDELARRRDTQRLRDENPLEMDDLVRRAMAAYFRTGARDGVVLDQPGTGSAITHWQGKRYVVLANSIRTLAVYRVRTSGQLKRLRRWPAQVADK